MINASELRIYNIIGCKVSNDKGIYQVMGIDGYKRIFKTEEDERIYNKPMDLDKYNSKEKQPEWHDEMLIRIGGGARSGEQYSESQLRGIKITEQILFDCCGFERLIDLCLYVCNHNVIFVFQDGKLRLIDGGDNIIVKQIKFLHELQNIYFFLEHKELIINSDKLKL